MEQKVKKEKSEETELYIPSRDEEEATIYVNSVGFRGEFRERERERELPLSSHSMSEPS